MKSLSNKYDNMVLIRNLVNNELPIYQVNEDDWNKNIQENVILLELSVFQVVKNYNTHHGNLSDKKERK